MSRNNRRTPILEVADLCLIYLHLIIYMQVNIAHERVALLKRHINYAALIVSFWINNTQSFLYVVNILMS